MTKIISSGELRHYRLTELASLFRTLQLELGQTLPDSPERAIVLATLDNVRRAIAARQPKPPTP